ncbi:hypothetical protein MMX123_01926 [Microbacterium sp. MM2322]|uniref:dioxygenase n=1 Tax=Microbacterium sp. MM2322 TaxID=3157631 RepID=UPI003D8098F3
MVTRGKDRQTREQRERARVYQARLELHERQGRRRRRDTVIGVVVGLAVILGAGAAQTFYFVAGPGAPVPAVTDAPTTPAPKAIPETPAPVQTE